MEQGWNEQQAMQRGGAMFEFPDGFKAMLGHQQRFGITEALFNPKAFLSPEMLSMPASPTSASIPTPSYNQALSLPEMIDASVRSCDVDVHNALLSNIVIVGGTTLLPGFTDRLQQEVSRRIPGVSFLAAALHFAKQLIRVTYNRTKSKSLQPVRQLRDASVHGLEAAYWPVWARSTNCGSAGKSMKSRERALFIEERGDSPPCNTMFSQPVPCSNWSRNLDVALHVTAEFA